MRRFEVARDSPFKHYNPFVTYIRRLYRMSEQISERIRSTFQVIGVVAIVMVVTIHYRSAATPSLVYQATPNQLLQEFIVNGICRVAVPLFALASGFFYFATSAQSLKGHLHKWRKRVSTLLAPYLSMSAIAVATWLIVRFVEGDPVNLRLREILWVWMTDPPAEQLWFLRDLMVLVLLAPVIGYLLQRVPLLFISLTTLGWTLDFNVSPRLGDWYVLNIETLTYFSWGAWLANRPALLEKVFDLPRDQAVALTVTWGLLIATRVMIQPDFDSWYVAHYTTVSLLIHQTAIAMGVFVSIFWASRVDGEPWVRLSGLSFFVYLVHDFPLRAVLDRFVQQTSLGDKSFWILVPVVTVFCFVVGACLNRTAPKLFEYFTGGRSPNRAHRLRSIQTNTPVSTQAY